jgi:DNA-binding PadR family transcriptional regulator
MLVALSSRPLHGYGLKKVVEDSSDGAIRLGPATLYRTLDDLADRGWIEETDETPVPEEEDDERRRYYRLTPSGLEALEAESARLDSLLSVVRARGSGS